MEWAHFKSVVYNAIMFMSINFNNHQRTTTNNVGYSANQQQKVLQQTTLLQSCNHFICINNADLKPYHNE